MKFFHLSTFIRRMRNNIDAIKTKEGRWVTSSNHIRNLFFSSFKNLFTEENVSFLENLTTSCITEEENVVLKKIPTRDEIKENLFRMQDLKPFGPDGFPALSYKEFWPTVGDRGVHGSGWVDFGPKPNSTRLNRFPEFGIRIRLNIGSDPTYRVIGLSGSESSVSRVWASYWAGLFDKVKITENTFFRAFSLNLF